MICNRIKPQLDDYLDGHLSEADARALNEHLGGCTDCRQTAERARALHAALQAYPVSGPSPGFYERALTKAQEGSESGRERRSWSLGATGALAASVTVLLVAGLLLKSPDLTPSDAIPGVSMAMHETRTVNLVFSSGEALRSVSLTVDLPPGIELSGYAGRDQITWTTRLQAGRNVLPLELVALGDEGGELVARLQHEGKEKIFKISVAVI